MAPKLVLALALLLSVSGIESRQSRGYDGGEVKPGKNFYFIQVLDRQRVNTGIRLSLH